MRKLIPLVAAAIMLGGGVAATLPAAATVQEVCTVKYNRTPFYIGGVKAGEVNAGQNIDVFSHYSGWVYGNLWGGARGVEISESRVNCFV